MLKSFVSALALTFIVAGFAGTTPTTTKVSDPCCKCACCKTCTGPANCCCGGGCCK